MSFEERMIQVGTANVRKVKSEITKEAFLREALIKIATLTETSVDLVNSKFGEVRESFKEIIGCSAHVESDYVASIGYDRTEIYYEKEKIYDPDNDDKYEYTKKERTVTDWRPYSGHISGDSIHWKMNGEQGFTADVEKRLIGQVRDILTVKEENISAEGIKTVDLTSFDKLKRMCEDDVELRISFPGDHHKDVVCNAYTTVTMLVLIKVPFYEVEYTYDGKQYKVIGPACGKSIVIAETPNNDIDIKAVAKNATKKYMTREITGWCAFACSYAFSWVMFAKGVYWTWFIPVICLIVAITLHASSNNKYSARVRSLTVDNIKLKHMELKAALYKYGYQPLTAEEERRFNVNECFIYVSPCKKRRLLWLVIFSVILLIALITTSLIVAIGI